MTSAVPRPPLRPLGVAEILDGAVRGVRRNFRAIVAIVIPFALARTVCIALIQLGNGSSDTAALQLLANTLVQIALGTVLAGFLTPVFTEELRGHTSTAREAVRAVGSRWFALLVAALVITAAEAFGLLLIVVAAWLWGLWAVAAPALVVERLGPFAAMGRSAHLVSGEFWRTWGVRALGYLLTSVLGFFVTLPFDIVAGAIEQQNPFATSSNFDYSTLFVVLTAIGALLAAVIVGPIGAAIDALLYLDLRMRREGMDLLMGLPPDPRGVDRPAVTAW